MDKYTNSYLSSIDSFKLFIDLREVKVSSNVFGADIIRQSISAETGEVLDSETLKANSYKHQKNLYQVHYGIVQWFKDASKKTLVILINSKMLEEQYIEGITLANIKRIYDSIQADKVVKFKSFEQFMNISKVTDIDIKRDVIIDSVEQFSKITSELEKLTFPSAKKSLGVSRFNKEVNKGIEWNERKTSTKARPFLKIYHKGIESKYSKNKDFFSHYIGQDAMSNIARFEATIRTKKDLKAYGILGNTLNDVLSIPAEKLDSIINDSLIRNTEVIQRPKKVKIMDTITPNDLNTITLIVTLIDKLNMSFNRALSYILEPHENKTTRCRQKKNITELYNKYVLHMKLDTDAQNLDSFLTKIGIL